MGGAVIAALVLATPAAAASPKKAKKRLAGTNIARAAGSIGSLTPAAADPRTAAMFGRAGLASSGFRFTPAGSRGDPKGLTVVVRARSTRPTEARTTPVQIATAETSALAPISYNVGVAVGWKRFALSGDLMKIETNLLPGRREALDLGVSYGTRRWSTRLQVGADRNTLDPRVGVDEGYSVDLNGSYSPLKNLEVTGGVRYRAARERLNVLEDERRDSQAVYIGTAFRF